MWDGENAEELLCLGFITKVRENGVDVTCRRGHQTRQDIFEPLPERRLPCMRRRKNIGWPGSARLFRFRQRGSFSEAKRHPG